MKFDSDAFDALLRRTGMNSKDIVFIDDNVGNISNAQRSGLDAVLFTCEADLKTQLALRCSKPEKNFLSAGLARGDH